jgi:hypothetical protein
LPRYQLWANPPCRAPRDRAPGRRATLGPYSDPTLDESESAADDAAGEDPPIGDRIPNYD